jgi:hypothetical protein
VKPRRAFPKSLADKKRENNTAHRYLGLMFDKPPMIVESVAAKRMRVVKERDGLSELQHQIRVITWWDKRCGDYGLPPYALLAIPNGGSRGTIEAVNLKRSGVRPGAEDLMLTVPRNGSHGLFVEMKLKDGRISDEQKTMAAFHFAQGYQSYIAYSNEQAIEIIQDYLQPQI